MRVKLKEETHSSLNLKSVGDEENFAIAPPWIIEYYTASPGAMREATINESMDVSDEVG